MSIMREISNLFRFWWKTQKKEKEIVFYTEHEGYYSNYEGLIKELINEHKQTLCYVTSDPHDPILKSNKSHIKTFYINKLLTLFMGLVNCRVLVMTLTDLNQYHIKRSVNPVHYVYVFHALVSTHMMYQFGAFDYYDTIFCVGPHQIKEIRKHEEMNKLKKKILIEAGYYRLERIYQAFRKNPLTKTISNAKGTILIAPSWGTENVLESCGKRLVSLLLKAGYEVIVRPHPETVRRDPELLALFSTLFGTNPHFTLETSVSADDSILRADVLICDCSGIAIEYAFGTKRPVLFLDVPIKIKNNRYKELDIEPLELFLRANIGLIVSPEKLDSIPQSIATLIADKEKYAQTLAQLKDQYVFAFERSSKVGAHYILDIVKKKRKDHHDEKSIRRHAR